MGWSTLTANSYNIYTIWTPPGESNPDNAAARITGNQGQKSFILRSWVHFQIHAGNKYNDSDVMVNVSFLGVKTFHNMMGE